MIDTPRRSDLNNAIEDAMSCYTCNSISGCYPSNQEGETRSLLFAESDKAQQRQEHVVWPSLKLN